MDKEITEYRVHEDNIPWLDAKFKKMQKVAVQVGSRPPTYKVLREEFKEHRERDPLTDTWVSKGYDKFLIISVDGEAPKVAGWSFVAAITHTRDGNLINKVIGVVEDVPSRYRTGSPKCDYCGLVRRRTDSFLVRNINTGEYQQVGRNCLAKFLGYSDPERVAQYASWLANLESDIGEQEDDFASRGGQHSNYQDLENFLTMVVAVTETQGWVTAAQARDTGKRPSINEVNYQLSAYVDPKYRIHPTGENRKRAKEAIAFARSDKLKTDTDFKHNLKISTASDMFHNKATGVVASLINFQDRDKQWEYQQEQRRLESEKRRAEFKKSEYVGEVGKRISVTVKVIRRRVLDSQFGPSYMFRMLDTNSNVFVWFASNDLLEEGKWYDVTGTVKKHEEYEGVRQTILTRCKVSETKIVRDELSSSGFGGEPAVSQVVSVPKRSTSMALVRREDRLQTVLGSIR